MLSEAIEGAVFLLNCPFGAGEVWDQLPPHVQQELIHKSIRLFVIDADKVAADVGMAGRINTVMQTCFFAISGVLPRDEAIARIKDTVAATYGRKGAALVEQNTAAIDRTLAHLHEVPLPSAVTSTRAARPVVSSSAPDFVRHVIAPMLAGHGDELPVSALPADGTYPAGTSRWEKRNIADAVPAWEPQLCIQCGHCVMVCPHAAIRARFYDEGRLAQAPAGYQSATLVGRGYPDKRFTVQVSVEDCTGCELCVEACPVRAGDGGDVRAISMTAKTTALVERERANLAFFDALPELTSADVDAALVRGTQYLTPLFEYSGACAGCGETPYLGVPRSTAATCRRPPGRSTSPEGDRHGPTRCSRTTPNLASGTVSRLTSIWNRRGSC
jgi:pyruvate-ferredoxin/flavodoxin oxidoreductase